MVLLLSLSILFWPFFKLFHDVINNSSNLVRPRQEGTVPGPFERSDNPFPFAPGVIYALASRLNDECHEDTYC
jgi:hypothetical protein